MKKTRVIYDNYNIYDCYSNAAEEYLREEYPDKEPTTDAIWDLCYEYDETYWDDAKTEMESFFDKSDTPWLAVGTVGRWNGTFAGGFVFNTFDELMRKIGKDCDYFNFTDENGHFYMVCSHHDGTNSIEVKRLTKAGERLLENWNYRYDKRYSFSERVLHQKLFNAYSTLPRFASEVYGC